MSLFRNYLVVTTFPIINLFFCADLFAADIYVDKTLSSVCTAEDYSATNRNCSGSDGKAYKTIQEAVNNMITSDDIYIRGGTYLENVLISGSSAPNGTASDYASIQSYPGEWAVIDGQNNQFYTIGKNKNGRDEGNDLAYWKFERLEITGGARTDGGAGLYINGGPFIVRYNYIHDNVAPSADENPGGIVGYTWRASIIEYNYFDNNGQSSGADGNAAHIAIFGDYAGDGIDNAENGFDGDASDAINKNEIRYNYFSGSPIAFKHKGWQFLTGRNPGTADYDDTFADWGDKIHHNYFSGQRNISLIVEQDFAQVYNNIFDNVPEAITINYQPDFQMYKVVTYNNTLINPSLKGIVRYGCKFGSFVFNENEAHYGADYSNLIDSSNKIDGSWFTGVAINIFNACGGSRSPYSNPDISNYINSHNYFYNPDNPDIFDYGYPSVFYTAAEFEAQTETGAPRVAYTNPYSAGNPLYAGTTGANQFITLGAHLLEGSTTITNGGIGGPHPYLSGVTLPSYVGAVDPNDSAWVAEVLSLTDIDVLMSGNVGGSAGTKPNPPTSLIVQ